MSVITAHTTTTCPECGALLADGMSCQDMLGAIIAWEAQDAELLNEHFLTVAAYNLQHPAQFTEAAIDGLRVVFAERLDHNLGIAEIRRRIGGAAAGTARVLKPEEERQPMLRRWSRTVADVYDADHPQGAAGRVRLWAASIRLEMEHLG